VHENLPREEAQRIAYDTLETLGYGHIAHQRSVACSLTELFMAQLVRAMMKQYAKIVIVRPFVMLRDTADIMTIATSVYAIAQESECMVLDMKTNRSKYEEGGEMCRIIV
jgi:hypothetical protein